MKRPEHMQRFEQALGSESPGPSLWDLAHALRDEGVSQIDLYFLYEHYHLLFQGDDPKADAITDAMDIIWGGGWAKGRDLYPHELTSEEIAEYRASA
ncbi:MAG TPA: hypothetical protein VN578_10900 [Candidatus Binatia bacterium]|jgi:hypothetical protein|nr:hypothetical protein [Candidatus Binatia bacterium]